LQFDNSAYPAAATGFPGDTNYARWEPITINAGYGGTGWEHKEGKGLVIVNEEFDGVSLPFFIFLDARIFGAQGK
jgi:hypothetical protein